MFNKYMRGLYFILTILSVPALAAKGYSSSIILDADDVEKGKYKYAAVLPYAFYTEDLSLAGGIAGGTTGYFQDQLELFGALMYTANNSYGVYFRESNYQIPLTNRLFLDTDGYIARYTKYREYIDSDLLLVKGGAGSNGSDKDDYIRDKGWDNQIEPTFSYVLPIGVGKDNPINTYVLEDGLLKEGATCRGVWNPFESGRTFVEFTPFVHWQDFSHSEEPLAKFDSNGVALEVKYDNTDFYENPSKGSSQRVKIQRDFGLFDSTSEWTALEFEFSKYFSLGECPWFSQQVIAFDFWTAYSPTMEYVEENGLLVANNAPPDYYGAKLGGLFRMRAYNDRRFHDKACIYYSLEYRVIPHWQPLKDINWLGPLDIDWWEFVLFGEAGRVAPSWDFAELNSDLKIDVGVSCRVMAFKSIARLDVAVSDEEVSVSAFIGHPF